MHEILDDHNFESQKSIRYADFIPVVSVGLILIWSLFIWYSNSYILNEYDFISYGLILVATLTYFKSKKLYLTILLLTFLVGLFGFLYWTPYHYGFSLFGIPLHPVSLLLLIILCISNTKGIESLMGTSKEQQMDQHEKLVQKFKDTHSKSSTEELQKILDGSGYRKELKEAVSQILEERKSSID